MEPTIQQLIAEHGITVGEAAKLLRHKLSDEQLKEYGVEEYRDYDIDKETERLVKETGMSRDEALRKAIRGDLLLPAVYKFAFWYDMTYEQADEYMRIKHLGPYRIYGITSSVEICD
jgi:uncharacterized protein YoaH (UPF0181 family)